MLESFSIYIWSMIAPQQDGWNMENQANTLSNEIQ